MTDPIKYLNISIPSQHALNLETLDNQVKDAKAALISLLQKNCKGKEWLGWFDWPEKEGFNLISQLKMPQVYFDSVVLVGIGGSYSGIKAVSEALSHSYANELRSGPNNPYKPIYCAGHNLSESHLIELLEVLEQKHPVVVVVSKSGTTTEPSVAFRVMRDYLARRYSEQEQRERTIVITDQKKGVLRNIADNQKLVSYSIPDDVGGRYSVLTAVGLVPLFLAGFNVKEMMQGAAEAYSLFKNPEATEVENTVLKHASIRALAYEQGKKLDIMAYDEPKVAMLVEWWKQLFGESEGKESKGLFPAGVIYSTDLHSLGQFLQDGDNMMLETFLYFDALNLDHLHTQGVRKTLLIPSLAGDADDGLTYLQGRRIRDVSKAAMDAAFSAHSSRGVACLKLETGPLCAQTLGYLFAYFQTVCAVSALLLDVNPFDQPGVEAYKQKMFSILGKP